MSLHYCFIACYGGLLESNNLLIFVVVKSWRQGRQHKTATQDGRPVPAYFSTSLQAYESFTRPLLGGHCQISRGDTGLAAALSVYIMNELTMSMD